MLLFPGAKSKIELRFFLDIAGSDRWNQFVGDADIPSLPLTFGRSPELGDEGEEALITILSCRIFRIASSLAFSNKGRFLYIKVPNSVPS